jgi:hypothetical protein
MTLPKKTKLNPKVPKCFHTLDNYFPKETVVSDNSDRNFPTIYQVGRCFACGCIVALIDPKEGK